MKTHLKHKKTILKPTLKEEKETLLKNQGKDYKEIFQYQ